MYRIPSFWRRFNRMVTVSDLITGRKVVVQTIDDEGVRHISIERPDKPQVRPFDKMLLTNLANRGRMVSQADNQTEAEDSTPSASIEETV
jgi:hypothetical protein